MRFPIKNYNVISFLLIWLVYIIITFLSKEYLFSDSLYFNNLSEQLSYERIVEIIDNSKKISVLSYFIIPILLIIKFTLIAFIFIIHGYLTSKKYRMKEIFSIIINAEIIFVFLGVSKILYFLIVNQDYNLLELQYFTPLSAINLFDYKNIAPFLIYPLQTINLFELFYWFALAYGISKIINTDLQGGMKVVLSSYVPALLLWMVFITFLTVNLS
jgi:hypothetical protein